MSEQVLSDILAQNSILRSELVRLARCGAIGDGERVRIQVMRLIRALRESGDNFAEELQDAVFTNGASMHQAPSRSTRRAATMGISEPVPADVESRLDLLRVEDPPVLPHRIIQDTQVLRRLGRLILEKSSQARLKRLGLDAPKAAIFVGPPGVGKTMAARHVAIELGLPLLILDLATVMSSFLGKSGSNLKQVFKFAQSRPCVFFLDEIDAIAKRRDDDADIGELKRLVTVLLQELDLWTSTNLLIAATNHPQLVDPALARRFDAKIEFPMPGIADLRLLAAALPMKNDPLPPEWSEIVAWLNKNSSHSNYVRNLGRLRRALVLGGRKSGLHTLHEMTQESASNMSKAERKQLGLLFISQAGMSQREASAAVGIARETLRSAKGEEA